jgi:hypothetical protein
MFAGIFAILAGCQDNQRKQENNISAFYFPFDDLEAGMVYEYRSINNPDLPPEYWYFQSESRAGIKYLKGTLYNDHGGVSQYNTVEFVQNGIVLRDLSLYLSNNDGLPVEIVAMTTEANVFPYEPVDTMTEYRFTTRYTQPFDSVEIILTKLRSFGGFKPLSLFENEYACISFNLKETLETKQEGYSESTWAGIEYYAKNIGLVYYRKSIAVDFILEYGLYDRYSLKVLQAKFNK